MSYVSVEPHRPIDPQRIRLERDGDIPLSFSGELIGEASNRTIRGDRQNRWTEVEIYRTAKANWVAHIIGRSCWDGEVDRHSVVVAVNPLDLVEGLRDDDGYLGGVSREALEVAGLEVTENIE